MKMLKLLATLAVVLFLSACSSSGSIFGKKGDAAGDGAESMPLDRDGSLGADPLNDPSSPLSNRVIYFDFDKSDIRPEFIDVINAHGRYLADNAQLRVRIEGHTDERGTREYNVALGERRANAVRQRFMALGVGNDQIQVISYGEEMPVAFGHEEGSWRLNRRAELIYEGR